MRGVHVLFVVGAIVGLISAIPETFTGRYAHEDLAFQLGRLAGGTIAGLLVVAIVFLIWRFARKLWN